MHYTCTTGVLPNKKRKKNPGEQKSWGRNNYTSSYTTIIMQKSNQWPLRLRGATMPLMISTHSENCVCVCVHVCVCVVSANISNE